MFVLYVAVLLSTETCFIPRPFSSISGTTMIFFFNSVSQKPSCPLPEMPWSQLSILFNYQRPQLCRIRVREKLLDVSDNPALTTLRQSIPGSFLARWLIAIQTHTAESHLQRVMHVVRIFDIRVFKNSKNSKAWSVR